MRTDLGWTLDPAVTFLNHGSFGACPAAGPRGPARRGATGWSAEPVTFLDRELDGRLDAAREHVLGTFLGADPAGPRVRAQRHDRRECRAPVAALRAGRRAADRTTTSTTRP